jgi:hypothetical protein
VKGLHERLTLAELLDEDPGSAAVSRDFLALYRRQYGDRGDAMAESAWERLVEAWITGGDSILAAQTRAVQDLRTSMGASTKKSVIRRILGL